MLRKRMQQGYSLRELLVVTALIGALLALILPAIRAARDRARRYDCHTT